MYILIGVSDAYTEYGVRKRELTLMNSVLPRFFFLFLFVTFSLSIACL